MMPKPLQPMATKLLHLAAILALASSTACSHAPVNPGAQLELGTGSWRFEPLEDGQPVELVAGVQGGWHVWISLRVSDLGRDPRPIHLTIQPSDESAEADEMRIALPFDPPRDDGTRQLVGYTGIVSNPSCWVGELVRLRATMELPAGEVLVAERDVTLLGGVYPPPACTESLR